MRETILLNTGNVTDYVIPNVDTFMADYQVVPRIYYYTIEERMLNPNLPMIEDVYERTDKRDKRTGHRIYQFKCRRKILR